MFSSLLNKLKRKFVAVTVIMLVLITSAFGLWERMELFVYDSWFQIRGTQPSPAEVVIVAIDDRSVKELGIFPWPRNIFASLIDNLKDTKVIGFDIVFDTPGTADDNALLAKAMKNHGKVVLASSFSFEKSGENIYQTPILPVKQLGASAIGIGFINTSEDLDNVVRRLTIIDVNYFKKPFPCFSLAVMLADRGMTPNNLKLIGNSNLTAGDIFIPLDKKNQVMIDFWGPAGAIKTYSYVDVLKERINPSELAGKIVLIGTTSATERDIKVTPYTRGNMVMTDSLPSPGVEIHASAIATYLSGGYYKRAPLSFNLFFLLLVGALSVMVLSKTQNTWRGLLYLVVLMFNTALITFLAWYYGHNWINLASPIGLILLMYTGVTAENLIHTELERRRTRLLFSRYVPPAVVEDLLKNSGDIVLGGIKREVTIIFSDIRGFTSFSESKPPEYIINMLNEYFTEMTEVIFKYGGTLDKYIGDGMMVFFGAPIHYDDHADRALLASIEMIKRLEELNERWKAKGQPAIDIGVGINSGPVVVGNVGCTTRMDYTIIGEDVNLASRLESMNKEYKSRVILSDRVIKYLQKKERFKDELLHLGAANVRGLTAPIDIYTVKSGG